MKTRTVHKRICSAIICMASLLIYSQGMLSAQSLKKVAVTNIDTLNIEFSPVAMGNLVRIELQKKMLFDVLDKHDMQYLLDGEGAQLDDCYSRTCIIDIGKILEVDQIITGSVERFDDKLVISLRIFDVATGDLIHTDISEYQTEMSEIDHMIQISLNNLLDLPNDRNMVELLENLDGPIQSKRLNVKMNGPRMGAAYISGDMGRVLSAPISQGGFNAYPVLSQLGYQFEIQYVSAGNFNALIETLGMVSGLEQGVFIPSVVFMNGFRFGKGNWEIAFGPSIGIRQMASGYYDGNNNWHLEEEWDYPTNRDNPYEIVKRFDSRGFPELTSRWVWAVGKTFRSGYLNIPCNIYFSPLKEGWYAGFSIGFNVSKNKEPLLDRLLK